MASPALDPLDPDGFPQLQQFAGGYLHQDFPDDFPSPEAARDAFLREASARERAAFAEEAVRFLAVAGVRPWAEVRRAFSALGSAWQPRSRRALRLLLLPEAPAPDRR